MDSWEAAPQSLPWQELNLLGIFTEAINRLYFRVHSDVAAMPPPPPMIKLFIRRRTHRPSCTARYKTQDEHAAQSTKYYNIREICMTFALSSARW